MEGLCAPIPALRRCEGNSQQSSAKLSDRVAMAMSVSYPQPAHAQSDHAHLTITFQNHSYRSDSTGCSLAAWFAGK